MLLENKTAVIYGAGAIGGAVARAFAREGANVFLASRTRATVDVLADQIAAEGGAVEAAHVDASDERAVEDHLDRVNARTGGIDILFDAIGMDDIQGTLILEMPLEDLMQPVVKALRTQFLTARAAARHMVGRGSGAIMSITVAPTPVPVSRWVRCGLLRDRGSVAEPRGRARAEWRSTRHPAIGGVARRAGRPGNVRASRRGRRNDARAVPG